MKKILLAIIITLTVLWGINAQADITSAGVQEVLDDSSYTSGQNYLRIIAYSGRCRATMAAVKQLTKDNPKGSNHVQFKIINEQSQFMRLLPVTTLTQVTGFSRFCKEIMIESQVLYKELEAHPLSI